MQCGNRAVRLGVGVVLGLFLLGCGSYANIDRDLDSHPVTDTGVAATILMPGEGIPMPATQTHGGLAPPPAPGQAGQAGPPGQAAAGARSGGGMVMIGGTTQDIELHEKVNNEPAWAKAFKLPFLVAAYPFMKAHQAITGPADPTVRVTGPPPQAPPTPAEQQAAREKALLEGMEQELTAQGPPQAAPAPRAALPAPTTSAAPASDRPINIAAELAALRLARSAPRAEAPAGTAAARVPSPEPAPPVAVRLHETVDRDADGRPDLWIYRQGRETVAEASDDDGDGRPERKVHFVPGTREPAAEEEDTNADGRADTFTEYEAGVVVRRRADSDGDGEMDTWSFYQDGEILRHEQDTNGDGFRDRMSFYEGGRLVREEEDRDGNGRPDLVTRFDEREQIVHQEEDTNGDDTMDVRSFYQEGKLRRRELIQ